jgi:hypothetical protein
VVNWFSKYCHFTSLGHPYTDKTIATAFFAEIVRLHDIPKSLVSNCDPVFTSAFWKELLTLSGAKLHMTTAFHPQADGQAEVANKVITMYLRWYWPRQWLPWAEYTYNIAFQTSLQDTIQDGVWQQPIHDPLLGRGHGQDNGGT